MHTREMHRGQCLTVNLGIGDKHTFGDHGLFLLLLLQIDVNNRTDKGMNGFVVGFCADYQHLVTQMELRITVCNGDFTSVLNA